MEGQRLDIKDVLFVRAFTLTFSWTFSLRSTFTYF